MGCLADLAEFWQILFFKYAIFDFFFCSYLSEIAFISVFLSLSTFKLHLRANLKNRRFARNRGLSFTGKSKKSPICP